MGKTLASLRAFVPLFFAMLGLGFLVWAAFVYAVIVGLVATGIAFLLIGYAVEVNSR